MLIFDREIVISVPVYTRKTFFEIVHIFNCDKKSSPHEIILHEFVKYVTSLVVLKYVMNSFKHKEIL